MEHTPQGEVSAPATAAAAPASSALAAATDPATEPATDPAEQPRGCLFALSQPPLMIFLAVIGCLLMLAAVHDLFVL
jgi:hypothetical protein